MNTTAERLVAALRSHRAGRLAIAETAYREILRDRPDQPDALHLLGVLLHQMKEIEAGASMIRRAIALKPGVALFHNNFANALSDLGQRDEAVANYEKALELNPHLAEAHNNLANALRACGQTEQAIGGFRRAIRLQPDYLSAHLNLGDTFRALDRMHEAIECYRRALQIDPECVPAHCHLGIALRSRGLRQEAVDCYRRALQLAPNLSEGHINLGNVLRDLGRLEEAVESYQTALRLAPDVAETHGNLGKALREQGKLDAAIRSHRRAIELEPAWADAHCRLALALLTDGQFQRGWESFRWRGLADPKLLHACPQPRWDGSPPREKTLLVSSEQTLGTQILFASVLPDVIAMGTRCAIECESRLLPLYRRSFPAMTVYDFRESRDEQGRLRLEGIDLHVHLGDLPGLFRNRLEDFPRHDGYLRPDPPARDRWLKRLNGLGGGFHVGISWRGGAVPEELRKRSIPLAAWQPVFAAADMQLVDVQHGETAGEIAACRDKLGVEIHHFDEIDPLRDLDGFAALLSALDLVISVDNSTAHLAGALGVPTWTLLPAGADWRWMRDRPDSPWFPGMWLLRQTAAGDWRGVLTRVAAALRELHPGNAGQIAKLRAAGELVPVRPKVA